jgi:endonuclease/exonuclease/phosphatase family metal-dependent hydrolase
MHVITYNVGNVSAPGASPEQVIDAIDPDDDSWALILQEISGISYIREVTTLLNERTNGAYQYMYEQRLRIGVIASGTPVDEAMYQQQFQGSTNGAYFATFDFDGVSVMFVGVHLAAIPKPRDTEGYVELTARQLIRILAREFFRSTSRADAALELVKVIEDQADNLSADEIIVAGDFNTIPASKTIRTMKKHFTDALEGTPGSRKGTYWKIRFLFRPRVDFIFLSKTIEALAGNVINDRSADHLPVYAEIELQRGSTATD